MKHEWWKEGVIYQIYTRSFNDSNGDGIGDLQGIIDKADYLARLGVDAVWLSPVFASPNDDNGYDISDYYSIMDDFGTLSDMERLIQTMHSLNIYVILDLVVNHTSDEHEWFIQSRSSKESPYRDYYIWRPGKDGKKPNNWGSIFSGSAWEYDDTTGEYYLHLFSKKQPDLNWKNARMRSEIIDMINWWIDRGVDGFRVDAVNLIGKPEGLPDADGEINGTPCAYPGKMVYNHPDVHMWAREIHDATWGRNGLLAIGECSNTGLEEIIRYSAPSRREFSMVIPFGHIALEEEGGNGMFQRHSFDLVRFKSILSKWQTGLHGRGHMALYLSNHDWPRALSRIGNDGVYRVPSAKLLFMLLASLEGTPFIYQGEEIGMTDCKYDDIDKYRDVATLNLYNTRIQSGSTKREVMDVIRHTSRDNARTPMQWSADVNAGFSEVNPWMDVNPNYTDINSETDQKRPDSIFRFYQSMIAYRKTHTDLVHGSYTLLEADHPALFAFRRNGIGEFLVVLNFSDDTVQLPKSCICTGPVDLSTYMDEGDPHTLRPWEGRICMR
ncbi:MAG: glycoside hydrolase family 13 protein [Spirochaetota bacterium]